MVRAIDAQANKDGQTLTVGDGVTLTNNGTIANNGTLTNDGTINVNPGGKLEGEVIGDGNVNLPPPEEEHPSLTLGDTYWFDLSKAGIPGTVNKGNSDGVVPVPDASLHWVPFTYTGTINAYSRTSEGVSTDQDVDPYDHSLFIADYNVTHVCPCLIAQRKPPAMLVVPKSFSYTQNKISERSEEPLQKR